MNSQLDHMSAYRKLRMAKGQESNYKLDTILNSEVKTTDLGASALSEVELERIALQNNGVVGVLNAHHGLLRADMRNVVIGDWSFQWIGTANAMNQGVLILKPKTGDAKRLSVIGKANHIEKEFEVGTSMALTIVRAMYGLQDVHDDEIIEWVVDLIRLRREKSPIKRWVVETAFGLNSPLLKDRVKLVVDKYDEYKKDPYLEPMFPYRKMQELRAMGKLG